MIFFALVALLLNHKETVRHKILKDFTVPPLILVLFNAGWVSTIYPLMLAVSKSLTIFLVVDLLVHMVLAFIEFKLWRRFDHIWIVVGQIVGYIWLG